MYIKYTFSINICYFNPKNKTFAFYPGGKHRYLITSSLKKVEVQQKSKLQVLQMPDNWNPRDCLTEFSLFQAEVCLSIN